MAAVGAGFRAFASRLQRTLARDKGGGGGGGGGSSFSSSSLPSAYPSVGKDMAFLPFFAVAWYLDGEKEALTEAMFDLVTSHPEWLAQVHTWQRR
jgi:hypothetical protein